MKKISSIIFYIVVLSATVLGMFATFVVWILSYPMGKKINANATCQFTRIWYPIVYYIGWLWGWRIKVEGKENLPEGPCIIMSNHQGYFDIPIFLCLSKTVRWVSKKEVVKMPVIGEVLLMRGDILIDRGSGASAKHMIEMCKKNLDMGISMIIYPEGTRTKTGDIGPFKAGGFLMAKQCGYPIVPSVIVGNYECLKGGYVNHGNRFILKILPTISKEEVENTDIKKMMAKVNEQITNNYEQLRHIN